jgi:predicted metal-dependent peptidase
MNQLSSDARLRFMAARIVAQNRWPYMSGLLFSLKPVEVTQQEVPTMAVDAGWRVYYCPEFVMAQPVEVLATALLHECMHCVLDHMGRFKAMKSKTSSNLIWNYCGDAHINKTLDDAQMPWGEFSPVRFTTLEKYGVSPENSTEAAYLKILEYLAANKESFDGDVDCGSGAGGGPRDYEIDEQDVNAPAIGQDDKEGVRDTLAIDVAKSAEAGDEVPGELKKWSSSRIKPQVDWRKHLGSRLRSSFAVASGKKDYSYSKPSRKQEALRQGGINVLLPSMRNPSPPQISVVIDTSGSITAAEIEKYASELFSILSSIGSSGKLNIIGCDTGTTGPFQVKQAADIPKLDLRGGGGTDLRKGIDLALQPKKVDIVIVATDGETPWHEVCPDRTVSFIGLFTTEPGARKCPTWMQAVLIN